MEAAAGKGLVCQHNSRMSTVAESLSLAARLAWEGDVQLWRVVGLSLRVSLAACALGGLFGLALGAWLAVARFPGRRVAIWLLNTSLAMPSVVVGLLVYLLLSRAGPLGAWGLLFTPGAMVLAQAILVLPLVAALTRRLAQDALAAGGEQLRSLGAGPFTVATLMLLHERRAVLTIGLTAFGRAVSEVGAVMVVGGNIDGVTRVMTTAIALETSRGDLALALALGGVLLAVVALLHLFIATLHGASGMTTAQRQAETA